MFLSVRDGSCFLFTSTGTLPGVYLDTNGNNVLLLVDSRVVRADLMKLSNWSGERLEWHYVPARAQSGRRNVVTVSGCMGIASCQGCLNYKLYNGQL